MDIKEEMKIKELLNYCYVSYKEDENEKSVFAGDISSGFKRLDDYIGGFHKRELIVIGSRPGVGKSAFAHSIIHNLVFCSQNPVKVGLFSFELVGHTVAERMFKRQCYLSNVKPAYLKDKLGEIIDSILYQMTEVRNNLIIQDEPSISVNSICSQIEKMVREEAVKIIFIDYLGLISTGYPEQIPRDVLMDLVVTKLKKCALEFNIPIVLLAQAYRDSGKDECPKISDLKDTDILIKEADTIILLDDPSKRLNDESENDDSKADNESRKIRVIVSKTEFGLEGDFELEFIQDSVAFVENSFGEEEKDPKVTSPQGMNIC